MHHNIYVVELDTAIWDEVPKFRQANPDYDEDMPCVYVGMTGLTPEERFKNHKRSYKSSKYVKKYGIELMPELYEGYNPMTYADASTMEIKRARELRDEGYGVWQN